MFTHQAVPSPLMEAMEKVAKDPAVERAGFCDLRRRSWTRQGSALVSDGPGSLWQALADCHSVLSLQQLPCRYLHWVLEESSVAGVHHKGVGTLGLLTKRPLAPEVFQGHLRCLEEALKEVAA